MNALLNIFVKLVMHIFVFFECFAEIEILLSQFLLKLMLNSVKDKLYCFT